MADNKEKEQLEIFFKEMEKLKAVSEDADFIIPADKRPAYLMATEKLRTMLRQIAERTSKGGKTVTEAKRRHLAEIAKRPRPGRNKTAGGGK